MNNKDLVQSQIQDINQQIEDILGTPINKELWNLIQSLIIKTHQYYNLNMEQVRGELEVKVKPIITKYKDELGI